MFVTLSQKQKKIGSSGNNCLMDYGLVVRFKPILGQFKGRPIH